MVKKGAAEIGDIIKQLKASRIKITKANTAAVNKENDAIAFLNLIQVIKNKFFTGSGAEKIPIVTKCRYHKCFHDEDPPQQCGNYTNFDLKKASIEEVNTEAGVKIKADELLK